MSDSELFDLCDFDDNCKEESTHTKRDRVVGEHIADENDSDESTIKKWLKF